MLGKILCSENLYDYDDYLDRLQIDVQPTIWQDRKALFSAAAEVDILLVRNQTIVDQELLSHCPNLKGVGRLGVGMDNVDLQATHKQGVQVYNGADCNTIAVAEYCLGQTINILRKLPQAMELTKGGEWIRPPFKGLELSEATIGIVGYGQIGKAFADRLRLLGANVLICSRKNEIDTVSLEELLSKSDVVSLHIPATSETQHMLGREQFEIMKPGAWILNTARGSIIDEKDLIAGLKNGKPAGVVLDVREIEPPIKGELEDLDNVYLTQHIACLTEYAQKKLTQTLLEDSIRVLSGQTPVFVVGPS